MRVGPFTLTGDHTPEHAVGLRAILDGLDTAGLPWHPFLSRIPRRIGRTGVEVRVTDAIVGGPVARYMKGVVYVRPGRLAMSTLGHEVGHAYDDCLSFADRRAIHRAMHDGTTADAHWVESKTEVPHLDPPVSEPHGWLTMRNRHDARLSEAFAWWFAWRVGLNSRDYYGRHRWSRIDQRQVIDDIVRTAARRFQVFPDVDPDSTHAEAIHALAAAGLITGYEDGTFSPNEPVTRAQLAAVLYRAKVHEHA